MQVWDVSSGSVVFEVGVKSINKEAWPLLHWGANDAVLFHGVTNTVHQYSRADGFKGECSVWGHECSVQHQFHRFKGNVSRGRCLRWVIPACTW